VSQIEKDNHSSSSEPNLYKWSRKTLIWETQTWISIIRAGKE